MNKTESDKKVRVKNGGASALFSRAWRLLPVPYFLALTCSVLPLTLMTSGCDDRAASSQLAAKKNPEELGVSEDTVISGSISSADMEFFSKGLKMLEAQGVNGVGQLLGEGVSWEIRAPEEFRQHVSAYADIAVNFLGGKGLEDYNSKALGQTLDILQGQVGCFARVNLRSATRGEMEKIVGKINGFNRRLSESVKEELRGRGEAVVGGAEAIVRLSTVDSVFSIEFGRFYKPLGISDRSLKEAISSEINNTEGSWVFSVFHAEPALKLPPISAKIPAKEDVEKIVTEAFESQQRLRGGPVPLLVRFSLKPHAPEAVAIVSFKNVGWLVPLGENEPLTLPDVPAPVIRLGAKVPESVKNFGENGLGGIISSQILTAAIPKLLEQARSANLSESAAKESLKEDCMTLQELTREALSQMGGVVSAAVWDGEPKDAKPNAAIWMQVASPLSFSEYASNLAGAIRTGGSTVSESGVKSQGGDNILELSGGAAVVGTLTSPPSVFLASSSSAARKGFTVSRSAGNSIFFCEIDTARALRNMSAIISKAGGDPKEIEAMGSGLGVVRVTGKSIDDNVCVVKMESLTGY